MPTKKTSKTSKKESFDLQRIIQNSDSYKSLVYGIVTVVVLFIVIALGVRTLSQNRAQIDENAAMTDQTRSDVLTADYTVSEGETLWSIAEKTYNDGYAWTEIAKANNLEAPYQLEKGQKLVIPKREPTKSLTAMNTNSEEVTSAPTPTSVPTATTAPTVTAAPKAAVQSPTTPSYDASVGPKISGDSYTVVKGDNLWNIAVRAYGDGYKWVEIAKLNNLANPDIIHPGNVFKLPR